jgi:uncharacterized membrane protein YhiD involved in acid resistance
MPNSITNLATAPLSVTELLLNLAIGTLLSLIAGWHYVRFGRSLSNRIALAKIFPFITLTTILIITVVKSSLALSLGLVGALSIVRFRTPIKEPEELAYLFLCIATGLALGANQWMAAVASFPIILVVGGLVARSGVSRKDENLFLNIVIPVDQDGKTTFDAINRVLEKHVLSADLRRMDVAEGELQATYFVSCRADQDLIDGMDSLRAAFPAARVTFVEQQNFLGG